MKAKFKKEYLSYLFLRTRINLTRYQINSEDTELIKNIFSRFINSENIHTGLFILFNIKEFKNLSKYLIFIVKKLEDNVINFENLQLNLDSDSEYIQNEILNFLSNPERKQTDDTKIFSRNMQRENDYKSSYFKSTDERDKADIETSEKEPEPEEEESEFRKNYLELIQTKEDDTEIVYMLPGMKNIIQNGEESQGSEYELPEENMLSNTRKKAEEISHKEEKEIFSDENIPDNENETQSEESENTSGYISEEELYSDQEYEIINNETDVKAEKPVNAEKIQLSEEIQEELNLFKENGENPEEDDIEDDIEDESENESEEENAEIIPANTLFIEYENDIRSSNSYLDREFENMIKYSREINDNEEERTKIILSIIETSKHLENISRKMSLEVISNIYQTVTLSFEKISESKYDITESTLNLFRKGLILVISLINGDNYFGYKDILKSIENIRNNLIEEKQKRETYLKRLQEKLDVQNNLEKRFPDESAREKVSILKKLIKEVENNFKSLEKITGEYLIYEALRSLSGSLINFKDIVKVSKELRMTKLVQLSESGYIFVKFLQNYRINPVTTETKEIFGYLIHNLKLLVTGRDADDIDLFISYLNDPVKIFAKSEKKKN